jgi:hypothetical protein
VLLILTVLPVWHPQCVFKGRKGAATCSGASDYLWRGMQARLEEAIGVFQAKGNSIRRQEAGLVMGSDTLERRTYGSKDLARLRISRTLTARRSPYAAWFPRTIEITQRRRS